MAIEKVPSNVGAVNLDACCDYHGRKERRERITHKHGYDLFVILGSYWHGDARCHGNIRRQYKKNIEVNGRKVM